MEFILDPVQKGVVQKNSVQKEAVQKDAVQKDSVQKDSTIYGDKHWTMVIKLKWINNLHDIRTSVNLAILQASVKIKYYKSKHLNLEIKNGHEIKINCEIKINWVNFNKKKLKVNQCVDPCNGQI